MTIEYDVRRIKSSDYVISSVGGRWRQAAEESGLDCLRAENVIGTSLDMHIADADTRLWLNSILESTLIIKKEVRGQYRCDTPNDRRTFLLKLTPNGKDSLRLTHSLIHAERTRHRVHVRYSPTKRGDVFRCSLCNSVLTNNRWIDPFELHEDLDLSVRYQVCPGCMYSEHTAHLFTPAQRNAL